MFEGIRVSVSDKVGSALAAGAAVVALESTVIAHGLPYPRNLETALALEAEICRAGAIPATVAVLDGVLRAGLSEAELSRLSGVEKLGTRDLPSAISRGTSGATTVSATAFIASLVGIQVFVTGGIGGVHRTPADISSDLWELTKSEVIVVSSGAKAILDLPATLEWLETHQVPVLGYGTDEFPAFYSRSTGLHVEEVDAAGVAARWTAKKALGMRGGMLVAVPIPEEHELCVDDLIDRAVTEAAEQGISGKEFTPWVLARLSELSGGRTVDANISLLINNARAGAEIARTVIAHQRRSRFV
ncbi:MAG: pseudouridine-5'-phosphate glycosidase [Armatimonadota bacterium]